MHSPLPKTGKRLLARLSPPSLSTATTWSRSVASGFNYAAASQHSSSQCPIRSYHPLSRVDGNSLFSWLSVTFIPLQPEWPSSNTYLIILLPNINSIHDSPLSPGIKFQLPNWHLIIRNRMAIYIHNYLKDNETNSSPRIFSLVSWLWCTSIY